MLHLVFWVVTRGLLIDARVAMADGLCVPAPGWASSVGLPEGAFEAWRKRNAVWLFEAAPVEAPRAPWTRRDGTSRFDLPSHLALSPLSVPAPDADARLDVFELLEAMREPGDRGLSAILRLGLRSDSDAIGHLRGVFEDRLSGRAWMGDIDEPVPGQKRIAAALALGLSGEVMAYQALRVALLDPRLEAELAAATILGLSYSGSATDARRFVAVLCDGARPDGPCEAAAWALGRHALRDEATDSAVVRAMSGGARTGGARGGALALWFDGVAEGSGGDALHTTVVTSGDPIARAYALIALAARGDGRALDLAVQAIQSDAGVSEFAVVALGLLGRADPLVRERSAAAVAEFPEGEASRLARRLIEVPGDARPSRRRTLSGLSAGGGSFSSSSGLGRLLDLASSLASQR